MNGRCGGSAAPPDRLAPARARPYRGVVREGMPTSVRFAALALGLAVAVQSGLLVAWALGRDLGWLHGLGATALLSLVALGLLRASRIAWRWGRRLGFALAAGLVVALILRARADGVERLPAALLLAGVALPLAAQALALGRRTAFEWFGLVCPRCGAATARGDVLMWSARCGRCGAGF